MATRITVTVKRGPISQQSKSSGGVLGWKCYNNVCLWVLGICIGYACHCHAEQKSIWFTNGVPDVNVRLRIVHLDGVQESRESRT